MKNWFSDRQLTFLIAMNVAIVLLATTFSDGLFIDIDNLQSMGGQVSELGILSIAVMLGGVSLFIGLIQSILRPHKVVHPCHVCGLRRHDPDAVHCKACGVLLNIPDEGL